MTSIMLYFRKFNFTLSRVLSVAKNFPAVPVPGQSVKESRNAYLENYKRSVEDPEGFWSEKANAFLTWTKPFTKALTGDFAEGTAKWFEDGQMLYSDISAVAVNDPKLNDVLVYTKDNNLK